MRLFRLAGVCLCTVLVSTSASASPSARLDVTIRGRTLSLAIYEPRQGAPRATVVMGSGDVGWVGLAVTIAEELSSEGYRVVGINVRQYLSAFTSGKAHVELAEVPCDFHTIADLLKARQLLTRPLIVSGVSEGAALAVLAASDPHNHEWIDGVITMGLPPSAELAWRWTDISAWFTKRDAEEPSFAPNDVIASVSPLPLYMIQSKKDEYVSPADYARLFATAKDPKQLTLIDASNHRFTDRQPELRAAYFSGLAWIDQMRRSKGRP